jgi:hypothetical protein
MTFDPFGGTTQTPWLPSDNLLLAAAGDPFDATAANALIAGSQYIFKITARSSPLLISNLWFLPSAAGVGASTGTFAGLFTAAGVPLTGSADAAAVFQSTNPAQVPMLVPQLVPPGGSVYGAVLSNLATTQPSLRCGVGATGGPVNVGLTAALARFGINGTGLTALTGFTPSGTNVATFCPWWGVS